MTGGTERYGTALGQATAKDVGGRTRFVVTLETS
jgi:hypothetical protein